MSIDPNAPNVTDSGEQNAGRIVLLNGPPSSGKSSLTRALQAALPTPWFHRSLDDFLAGYQDRWLVVDDGSLFNRVMAGYLGSLRQLALAGNDILAEAVITPSRRALYQTQLTGLSVTMIAVRCSYEEALRRERQRGDRRGGPIDLPADEFHAVYEGLVYDVEVDTESSNPEQLAEWVAQQLSR